MMSAPTTSKDIADCISCWLAYLQMLNGLCSAGSRLSACLCGLSQENHMLASHCQAMWEELVKASTVASSNIKTNMLTALQELTLADSQTDLPRNNEACQGAISNSLAALIHLQYQFCAACCECLGPVLGCPCPVDRHESECCTEAMHSCFQRLFPPPPRSPLSLGLPALAPLTGCQRRWSEAAAQDVSNAVASDTDGTMRRWSMPWESSKLSEQQAAWPGSRLMPKHKLTVPSATSQERSRSTTPESVVPSSMASQEELQEVIQLLSCPSVRASSNKSGGSKPSLPAFLLTDPWSDVMPSTPASHPHPVLGSWWSKGEEMLPVGASGDSMGMSMGPCQLSGAAGAPLMLTLEPPTPAVTASSVSRKSSSSTDSSSSYSLHTRSTTASISTASAIASSCSCGGTTSPKNAAAAAAQEVRTNLYSMWSGSDVPFIKLPESLEANEETTSSDVSF